MNPRTPDLSPRSKLTSSISSNPFNFGHGAVRRWSNAHLSGLPPTFDFNSFRRLSSVPPGGNELSDMSGNVSSKHRHSLPENGILFKDPSYVRLNSLPTITITPHGVSSPPLSV